MQTAGYGQPGEYGGDPPRLQLCVGHEHMIGLPNDAWVQCEFHHVDSSYDDEDLEKPVTPVAYLPHSCDQWIIGGRNELLELRDDIDRVLEFLP